MANNRKALVVGIDYYNNFNNLEGCTLDAERVAELFRTHADGSKNFDVHLSVGNVSHETLLQEIRWLFSGRCETALFYFAGHGFRMQSHGEYICTTDGTSTIPGIKLGDITEIIAESECENKIVILDSCFSGGAGNTPLLGDAATLKSGVTFLSACDRNECADETEEGGVFTNLLVNALSGEAADLLGNISPGSVYAYIDKALSAWDQRPIFKTNVREFISLRSVAPPVTVLELKRLKDFFVSPESQFALDPSFEFTNSPDVKHEIVEPYANATNVEKLKYLQKMVSVGLVEPVGEKHMYFAVMNSKSCKLTPLGRYYLHLAKRECI